MESKKCIKCSNEKPTTDFYSGKNTCKPCMIENSRVWKEKNKERIELHPSQTLERKREYGLKHRNKIKQIVESKKNFLEGEKLKWIAEQEKISHKKNLTSSVEELTSEVAELKSAIKDLTNMLFALVNTLDKK